MDEMQKQELDGNEKWKKNVRTVIYGMAGVYLLTLAYDMFRAISASTENEQLLMIVFTVIFTVAGVGMIFFCLISIYRSARELRKQK